MAWKCPACMTLVLQNDADILLRPNVIYRCSVCHLELVADPQTGKMILAPVFPLPSPEAIP